MNAPPRGKPRLVVDARMIRHSGIGTYLRNLLPRIAEDTSLELWLGGDRHLLSPFPWFDPGRLIPLVSGIYSLREQAELPLKIPPCDVFWSPHYNVPLFPIRARRRLTTVHDVFHLAYFRSLSPVQKLYAPLVIRGAARLSRAVITVSEFSRSEMIRLAGMPAEKIKVIPNGIEERFRDGAASLEASGPYVLFVGNVKPHKNLRNALAAFARVARAHPGLKLCIVGRKEGFLTGDTAVAGMVQGALRDRVVFTGYVSDAELKGYYAGARAFILPSLYEGFGLPLLEAMAFGLPIASSNRASLPEVGGDAVLYFDPEDVEAMAACLEKALSAGYRPDLAAYRARMDLFSWERSGREHLRLIHSLL